MWKWLGLGVLVIGIIAACIWAYVGKTTGEYIDETIQAPDIARENLALPQVEQKIRMHYATKGTYPATLEELGDLPRPREGYTYDYDPETGKVALLRLE